MGRRLKNYLSGTVAVIMIICFVLSLIAIIRDNYSLNLSIILISVAIISFFAALFLLMQVKKRGQE